MQPIEVIIPVVFFLMTGLVLGLWLLTRHKERITMIERGLKAEEIRSFYARGILRANPLASLKWGIVFVSIGVAVILGMWLRSVFYVTEGIFPALIALCGGTGLIIFYRIASRKPPQEPTAL